MKDFILEKWEDFILWFACDWYEKVVFLLFFLLAVMSITFILLNLDNLRAWQHPVPKYTTVCEWISDTQQVCKTYR